MTDPGWYTDPLDSSQYRYWDGAAWTEAVSPGSAAEAGSPGSAAAEAVSPGSAAAEAVSPGSAAAEAGDPITRDEDLATSTDDQTTRSISVEDLLGADGEQQQLRSAGAGFEPPQPFPGSDDHQQPEIGTEAETVPNGGYGVPQDLGAGGYPTEPPPYGYEAAPPQPEGQSSSGFPYAPDGVAPNDPSWIPENQMAPRPIAAPPTTRRRSKAPWLILGAVIILAAVIVGFVVIGLRDRTSVDAIVEGQCFADFEQFQESEIRSSVSTADCVQEHALEVFEVTSDPYLDFADYPGSSVIEDVAFEHCLNGFQDFVGIAYEESLLDVWALYPTEGSWNLNDDREVVCMVGAFDQSLTVGTLQGSGR